MAVQSMSVPMTLSDLERHTPGVIFFWLISIIMLVQLVHKMTEFGTVIQVGRSTYVSRDQPRPPSKGGATAAPPHNIGSGPPACVPTVRERSKFCALIKLDVRKILTLSTTNDNTRSVCSS